MKINKFTVPLFKFPNSEKWLFWVLVALLIKTTIYFFTLNRQVDAWSGISGLNVLEGGDMYLLGAENLIQNGNYAPDYRMPGYDGVYFLLRLFFSRFFALNLLGFFQLILSSISVYVLGLIGKTLFKSEISFIIIYFLYLISTYVSLYDPYLLTESLCASSLIFSFFFLLKSNSNHKLYLLISGLFITWSIFLKPVITPVLLLFIVYVITQNKYLAFKPVLFLFLPFLCIDGIWTFRNLYIYNKVIPLTKSVMFPYFYQEGRIERIEFIKSIGGSICNWEPGSEISFFLPVPEFIKKKIVPVFPEYIYTTKFNYDSLLLLKYLTAEISNKNILPARKLEIESILKNKYLLYTQSIKEEKPFLYYVYSRIKLLKRFIVHSGTQNLYSKISTDLFWHELIIKYFYSLFYWYVLLIGSIGIFWIFWFGCLKKIPEFILLSLICLYLTLVFPFVLGFTEYRYFVPVYPFFIISGSFILLRLTNNKNLYLHDK